MVASAGSASPFHLSSPLMKLLLLCLTAGCLPLLAFSQNTQKSYDCYDPNNREDTHQVRRGEIMTVCLYVGPGGDWNSDISYKRFSVNLIADEFSSYDIPGCKWWHARGGYDFLLVHVHPPPFTMDMTPVSSFRQQYSHNIFSCLCFFSAYQAITSTAGDIINNSDAVHIFASSQTS